MLIFTSQPQQEFLKGTSHLGGMLNYTMPIVPGHACIYVHIINVSNFIPTRKPNVLVPYMVWYRNGNNCSGYDAEATTALHLGYTTLVEVE